MANISYLTRIAYTRKITGLLLGKEMSFNDIVSESNISRRYVNILLKELKTKGDVEQIVKEGRVFWKSTKRGYLSYNNAWTALSEDLSNIVLKGGSYLRHSNQPAWPEQYLAKPPPIIFDNASYPANLEVDINTIKIQYELSDLLVSRILNALDPNKEFPPDSKLILGYEVDLSAYSKFIKEIKRFMDVIKGGRDVFVDSRLEFKDYQFNRLTIFEAYLNNADLIKDDGYQMSLDSLLKSKTFVKFLLSLERDLDETTLSKFISIFKAGKDPLDSKPLVKKLIIPYDKGFIMPLYSYVTIARILNHKDKEIRERLNAYEVENRYRPDISKTLKIQNELRGKRK
jgi:hypothetical protein